MTRLTFTASWVLPVDGPPLPNGQVVVEGGTIAWVGAGDDPSAPEAATRDLGSGVLLPGLVNAHCHLELSHLQGAVPLGQGFVPWVEALVAARPEAGAEEARDRTAAAVSFLEQRGTVAVGDISNDLAHLDLLERSRLRAVVFLEVLAWDPSRVSATEAWIAECLAVVPDARGVEVRVAAHAPHSVSPEHLRRLVEWGGIGSVHLAESPEEVRFLKSGDGPWAEFLRGRGLGDVPFDPPGVSPTRYLDELGLLREGMLAVHGVHLDEDDRARLAELKVSVALCPRSNRNLGVGRADVPALLEAGIPLCLGTDSLASAETLDVLDDAVLLGRQFPDLDPAAIVRMATAGGAEALGLDDLGTLTPGKQAALAFVPAEEAPGDPWAHVVSGASSARRVEVR